MIVLYLKDSPDKLKQVLFSLKVPFKSAGNVFVLNMDREKFISMVDNFPREIVGKMKIYVAKKDEISKIEDLIEIGFRSVTLEEFVEEYLFQSLLGILNTGETQFHPIIDTRSRRVYGFEALCRLSIPINKLFKVSDRISYIADKFCRERALLEYINRSLSSYHLFLNFHPKFLKNPLENVGELMTSLMGRSIEPSKVVVEIDEYEGMDIHSIKLIRDFLKAEGVQVALDDVGAGYSGLYHLTEIHPDIAKLDISLIRDIHKNQVKQAILSGLVKACRETGVKVLAEGVEKVEELKYLMSLEVELLQGFVFAKPSSHPDVNQIEEIAYNLLT
ncbi:MAG: EAL domain-containing protein [Aquificaceae bacterium]|jgi:EAL domain-containing protein (putative c-di-GMP-specific phosphodiesterase class I)|nr:MAG: EAL domain-containing protein [Aquificota bacterium]